MARPSKLTPDITKRIGDGVSLGLTYALAAESAGITYKTFNDWMNKGKIEKSSKYYQFYIYIQKCHADAAKVLLERINKAIKAGNTQMCTWILERRFSEDFGRRIYKKTNIVSENKNVNVDLAITDADGIRKQILAKFDLVRESKESLIT